MPRFTRTVLLLVLFALAIAAPPALAGSTPRDSSPRAVQETPGLMAGLWHALVRTFAPLGSIMDPNGAPTATCDRGSIMDPNGCPGAQATPDLGSIMDPDG
jgi:hypothetical protein